MGKIPNFNIMKSDMEKKDSSTTKKCLKKEKEKREMCTLATVCAVPLALSSKPRKKK